MNSVRNYRGWLAAWTLTITLSVTLLVLDRYNVKPGASLWEIVEQTSKKLPLPSRGIVLETDTTLADASRYVPSFLSMLPSSDQRSNGHRTGANDLLRRPPEPASNAVLHEPLSAEDFVSLPLSKSVSNVEQLMQNMDAALDSPMQMVSTDSTTSEPIHEPVDEPAIEPILDEVSRDTNESPEEDFASMQGLGESLVSRIPAPTQLFHELNNLRDLVASCGTKLVTQHNLNDGQRYVATPTADASKLSIVQEWINQSHQLIDQLLSQYGLDDLQSRPILDRLAVLGQQSTSMGEGIEDYQVATAVIRTGYSLQRRVAVWNAVSQCLNDHTTPKEQPQINESVRHGLEQALADVEKLMAPSPQWDPSQRKAWRSYLMLDELTRWIRSREPDSHVGNQLARDFSMRLETSDLTKFQLEFLDKPAIRQLAARLSNWNQEPIDYRQLLSAVEQVEGSQHSRLASTISQTIHRFSYSEAPTKHALAQTLNDHYRNANLRLTLSRQLVERFLPEGQYEVRPVRQTILGAFTYGDSGVHTKIAVRLRPDPHAWNIELGVTGDVLSNTQSSKGPATLHNTAVAQVNTQRLLRVDSNGVQIAAVPTQVSSQSYLNGMRTDFDGLPILRDFARWMVREQFNQKRGIAGFITRQKIASEADTELDRRLDENLAKVQKGLQDRILGPLNELSLDPTVVAMSTTEDRLTLRYRLAHQSQLTVHTPRPRAPVGALASLQVHQSAINNTVQQIGLGGRQWTLPELYRHVGDLAQTSLTPPDDVPDDITIRFAQLNPIVVELREDRMRIHLRIAEFKRQEGLSARNFVITSTYMPMTEGLRAGLVRDPETTVEIQGKHLSMRDRLALRVIFSKVFVGNSQIPLIAQKWLDDPKATGLAVSQFELRDGWLGLAISDASRKNEPLTAGTQRAIR